MITTTEISFIIFFITLACVSGLYLLFNLFINNTNIEEVVEEIEKFSVDDAFKTKSILRNIGNLDHYGNSSYFFDNKILIQKSGVDYKISIIWEKDDKEYLNDKVAPFQFAEVYWKPVCSFLWEEETVMRLFNNPFNLLHLNEGAWLGYFYQIFEIANEKEQAEKQRLLEIARKKEIEEWGKINDQHLFKD